MRCGWDRLELVLCSLGERLMEAAQAFWLSLRASQTGLGESEDGPEQVTSRTAMLLHLSGHAGFPAGLI